MIDGLEEASQELAVAPGATSTVTFTVTRGASGAYSVEINGLGGEFTVTASPPPWALLVGTLGGIAVTVIIPLLIWHRRRAA